MLQPGMIAGADDDSIRSTTGGITRAGNSATEIGRAAVIVRVDDPGFAEGMAMADAPLQTVLRHVRTMAAAPPDGGPSDEDLLGAFSTRRDEEAFAALVRRHGAMVFNVCRRVLHHRQDAEDAFQATFLVLAHKAATLRQRTNLAAWLYGSAYRAALGARRAAVRRRLHEGRAATRPSEDPAAGPSWREVQVLLEEEIRRLPEKYRLPFVLCCLDDLGRAEAARRLGLKEGTLSGRLDQARKRLRRRLASRGVTLAAVLAASALAARGGAAAVPASLGAAAVRAACVPGAAVGTAAARLAAGVERGLRATFLARLAAGLSLALAVSAGAGGLVARQAPGPKEHAQAEAPAAGPRAADEAPARADRNGDPLPAGAVARLGTVRFRHGSQVTGLAFAPDGRTILSCAYDRTLRVWDVATGREVKRFADPVGSFAGLCASADGQTIAARSFTGQLRYYDVRTGRLSRPEGELGLGQVGMALSPDGKTFAAALEPGLSLFDVASGKAAGGPWGGHQGKARSVAYAPDGKWLASGGDDGLVLLRDAATGAVAQRLAGKRPVLAVAFSPDGRVLAAGGGEGGSEKLRLWDVLSGKLRRAFDPRYSGRLPSGETAVAVIAFSADGKVIASGGSLGQLDLWDAATGKPLWHRWAYAEAIAFSPDGKGLASAGGDRTIRFWDVSTGQERPAPADGHRGGVQSVAVSQDGTVVATAGWDDAIIRLWDRASGKELRRIDASNNWFLGAGPMALSPDGKAVATHKGVWDTATGRSLLGSKARGTAFKGPDLFIESIAFAPDGKTLAMGTRDGQSGRGRMISLWDAATGAERGHFGTHAVGALAYAPDGKVLASGHQDGTVSLWDVATGREVCHFAMVSTDGRGVNAVAFSPDGRVVASSTFAGDVCLWDARGGKLAGHLGVPRLQGGKNVLALAFAPNGKALAAAGQPDLSGDGTCVRLWELATGRERLRLAGHQGDVTSLAFASGSRFLVSGSSDSTALVWDLAAPAGPAPAAADPDGLWDDLLGADAGRAYAAACRLARSADGVRFLGRRLPPVGLPADADRVARLVKSLDSDEFAQREKASRELARLGEAAEPLLRKALEGEPAAETRRRLNEALENLSPEGERLRAGRAVEALELAGTPEARQVLESLARGVPGARRTREAQAALERLRAGQLDPRP
jgi:RNA polymerase sigma factor (sigma-70 family)